jgi:hemerythrin-like domain-containing protein
MTTTDESLTDQRDMFAAHTMFRREFGLMPDLVRAVRAGDKQGATLVADHVALVSDILSLHHSAEDKYIWPRLRERCPEESASLADVMKAQHHAIHTCLLQVTEAEQAWRDSASADARGALAAAIDQLIAVTTEHLALEEQRVIPLSEKYITDAEYGVLVQEQAAYIPQGKLTAVLGMIMYDSDPAAIDAIVSEMPVEAQPVIKDLAVKAYDAYAAELYRTAEPGAAGLTPAI